jgi:two-component system cell cycle sensor histidine kinase/response regulator CckA
MKRGQTLLLVEDDSSLRKFMSQALKDNGFHVLETSNGKDALEMANRHRGPIHMLVTDIILGGPMDGIEVGSSLRRLRPEMRVLYVSGYPMGWDGRWDTEVAAEFFLPKPFSAKGLLEAVAFCVTTPAAAA